MDIFEKYNKYSRPVKIENDSLEVNFGLSLQSIIEVVRDALRVCRALLHAYVTTESVGYVHHQRTPPSPSVTHYYHNNTRSLNSHSFCLLNEFWVFHFAFVLIQKGVSTEQQSSTGTQEQPELLMMVLTNQLATTSRCMSHCPSSILVPSIFNTCF